MSQFNHDVFVSGRNETIGISSDVSSWAKQCYNLASPHHMLQIFPLHVKKNILIKTKDLVKKIPIFV